MAWTAPRDWNTGEIETAAIFNTHVRDNLNYLKGNAGQVVISDELASVVAAGGSLLAQGTNNSSFARYRMLCKDGGGATIDWRFLANGASVSEFGVYESGSTERMRIAAGGNVMIGAGAPQGKLHVAGAGGGGLLVYPYSGLGASTTTILPAGSVTAGFTLSYITKSSSGSVVNAANTTLTTSGGNAQVFNESGTNIFQLNYVGDGSVTLTRTAGTRTYSGVVVLVYF